jgi:hypothetical protein
MKWRRLAAGWRLSLQHQYQLHRRLAHRNGVKAPGLLAKAKAERKYLKSVARNNGAGENIGGENIESASISNIEEISAAALALKRKQNWQNGETLGMAAK